VCLLAVCWSVQFGSISPELKDLESDLKLFYSLRLALNTDPTYRQRLHISHMVLYKFDYYYYYYSDLLDMFPFVHEIGSPVFRQKGQKSRSHGLIAILN